jgi:uncharacterized protein DUF5996
MPEAHNWPELPLEGWQPTYATLHRWVQIVGKVRLARMPWINHSWSVTLYVTARGLTTGLLECGDRSFQIDFDFVEHKIFVRTSDGGVRSIELRPRTVADFYQELMASLDDLGVATKIDPRPNELDDATRFVDDTQHSAYDPDAANRCWRVLAQAERVFTAFRARFIGKCSPVHFFWGAFDLAVTRFSGRPAPKHPGGVPHLPDWVAREAYSHEVSSAGFWPGDARYPAPAFYSYAYPEPPGYKAAAVRPSAAEYNSKLGEFLLPYDAVRTASNPWAALMEFLQSTYDAAADCGKWDRKALEWADDPRSM